MNELQHELFEGQLTSIARGMEYPSTPEIAGSVMRRIRRFPSPPRAERRGQRFSRRLAWSLTVLLMLCASLMLIPAARAAILEFIQVGVVRIFRAEPTPVAPPQQVPPPALPATATPTLTPEPLIPLLEALAGDMTLAEAQQAVNYPLLLPSYPPDLGPPDRVFVQEVDGQMTIMVWIDPDKPDEVLMSLHFLPPGSWAVKKVEPSLIEETTVDGEYAVWTVGPYPVRYTNGNLDITRLITGHVLIWASGTMTYRLETGLSLEEAVRVAESLEPIP